jgi:endonuclease/exonuclease/phosphatase family metal-dependent hydrolase
MSTERATNQPVGLAEADGPQLVAGGFNACRDHRPFRDVLAARFLDCVDAAEKRAWPGFSWPVGRVFPPVMRLDHVLVSRAGLRCASRGPFGCPAPVIVVCSPSWSLQSTGQLLIPPV